MNLKVAELSITTYTPATPRGPIRIRIAHKPTGLFVEREGFGYTRTRDALLDELEIKVASKLAFDRRMRLIAKLIYPQIDTQRTSFVYTNSAVMPWFYSVPQAVSDAPSPYAEMGYVHLTTWRGVGRRSKRVIEITSAYIGETDTCVIYKDPSHAT